MLYIYASKDVNKLCVCDNRNMASMLFFCGGGVNDSLLEFFGDVDANKLCVCDNRNMASMLFFLWGRGQ